MQNNKELHYRYVLSYLFFAIILLLALTYYDVPNLVDKFSFALTLSSLLLAVLAIFFTILSSQKQDSQLTKLIETNTNIGKAADEVRFSAKEISRFAQEAPQHFQNLGDKIENISTNFSSIESTQLPSEEATQADQPIQINKEQFETMFISLQYNAMAILYLFEGSFRKSKIIEAEVFSELDLFSFEYAAGVLNGIQSTGLISYKHHKKAIVPTACSDVIKGEIKDIFPGILKVIDEKSRNNLQRKIESIDEYLA